MRKKRRLSERKNGALAVFSTPHSVGLETVMRSG